MTCCWVAAQACSGAYWFSISFGNISKFKLRFYWNIFRIHCILVYLHHILEILKDSHWTFIKQHRDVHKRFLLVTKHVKSNNLVAITCLFLILVHVNSHLRTSGHARTAVQCASLPMRAGPGLQAEKAHGRPPCQYEACGVQWGDARGHSAIAISGHSCSRRNMGSWQKHDKAGPNRDA